MFHYWGPVYIVSCGPLRVTIESLRHASKIAEVYGLMEVLDYLKPTVSSFWWFHGFCKIVTAEIKDIADPPMRVRD